LSKNQRGKESTTTTLEHQSSTMSLWMSAMDEAFDFIQVVKEPTWERIHNNNVGTSILIMSMWMSAMDC
jgi:hypothetical protein